MEELEAKSLVPELSSAYPQVDERAHVTHG